MLALSTSRYLTSAPAYRALQPPGGVDEDFVASARDRIGREKDTRGLRRDQPLHDDGQRDRSAGPMA